METKNVVIVVALVLLAVVSYPTWLPKATLMVGREDGVQTNVSITIRLTPPKSSYDSGEQITVSGTLTCTGICPLAAMPYPYMDVSLTSSWGWTKTVETSASGVYSTTLTLPTEPGSYQITATFQKKSATAATTVIPEFPFTPLTLLLSLFCLLLITRRFGKRIEKK